ncbi:Hypothetical predicted protein, partial [Scomber scombrus]
MCSERPGILWSEAYNPLDSHSESEISWLRSHLQDRTSDTAHLSSRGLDPVGMRWTGPEEGFKWENW